MRLGVHVERVGAERDAGEPAPVPEDVRDLPQRRSVRPEPLHCVGRKGLVGMELVGVERHAPIIAEAGAERARLRRDDDEHRIDGDVAAGCVEPQLDLFAAAARVDGQRERPYEAHGGRQSRQPGHRGARSRTELSGAATAHG